MAAQVANEHAEVMTYVEKQVLLQTLDHLWREHLVTLDHLRQVVGWRGYAQRDPLNEYKAEAFELFDGLITHLREQVTAQLMRVEVMFRRRRAAAGAAAHAGHAHRSADRRGRDRRRMDVPRAPAMRSASRRRARPWRPQRDPNDPSTWGQRRPQRALPLRLGQEVQALPRPFA